MTFNDMLIPAVGSASLDEEPMRSCDCIHFPTVAGMLWLKCPLRQHHLIYRMRGLAMKTCNVRCSALAKEDVTFELAAQRLARAEAFATTKPRGSSSLQPNLISSRSRVSGEAFRGTSALCSQPCFESVKIQREEADTSVQYMKVAASGMSARLEG